MKVNRSKEDKEVFYWEQLLLLGGLNKKQQGNVKHFEQTCKFLSWRHDLLLRG